MCINNMEICRKRPEITEICGYGVKMDMFAVVLWWAGGDWVGRGAGDVGDHRPDVGLATGSAKTFCLAKW